MKRRSLLQLTGAALVAGSLGPTVADDGFSSDCGAVEWLAWHLWQHGTGELAASQVSRPVQLQLDQHPQVLRTLDDTYRFTDPRLADVFVAYRLFRDIAQDSASLLATAQTSHTTDLAIGALARDHEAATRALTAWTRRGPTAVLRVNSAGILAKVGSPDLGDTVISALRHDAEARQLYLTAVAGRALDISWDQAAHLASSMNWQGERQIARSTPGCETWARERLTAELANPHDAAARWCAALLLAALPDADPDTHRPALLSAVARETCRENLRSYAAILAGADPLMS